MAASRDLGEFIRELRSNARISLRQLAAQAGVSNPYLSQIERGLRKPSAEVLQQIANALRVSTPVMYLRAGLLAEREGQGVLAAIAADPDLTDRHKKTLIEIYEAFRRENLRTREEAAGPDSEDEARHDNVLPLARETAPAAPEIPGPAPEPVPDSPGDVPPATRRAKRSRGDGDTHGARGTGRKTVTKAGRRPRRTGEKAAARDQKEES